MTDLTSQAAKTLSLKMAASLDAGIRAVISEKLGHEDWSLVDALEYCTIKIKPDIFADGITIRQYDISWLDEFIGRVEIETWVNYEKLLMTATVKVFSKHVQP